MADIKGAAAKLYEARASRLWIEPVSTGFGIATPADAYAVQKQNSDRWESEGRRRVGHKIGLTSKAVQQQLGVSEPDFGVLWKDQSFATGAVLSAAQFISPRIEAEIAFVVGRELADPEISLPELVRGLDCALAAFEIVDSAIARWEIKLADTIADNASGAAFVLGNEARSVRDIDLRLCGMVMSRRTETVSVGLGAACMGHPLNAVLWLARRMAELGEPLQEGSIVLSGALGPMVPVSAGDVYLAEIAGFAPINVEFEA
jgi:2-keto-4-pentenoate hydratase